MMIQKLMLPKVREDLKRKKKLLVLRGKPPQSIQISQHILSHPLWISLYLEQMMQREIQVTPFGKSEIIYTT